jgi:RimJ/RimL family protein N-acetyltransferase
MGDLHAVHAYAADPENMRFMMFLPNETIEETADFIRAAEAEWQGEAQRNYEFVILRGDELIGGIDLCLNDEPGSAELGWILNKAHWGHGYAAEAARALIDAAKQRLGIRHFIAHCDSENRGSWRVMEKLGMRCTGSAGGRKAG